MVSVDIPSTMTKIAKLMGGNFSLNKIQSEHAPTGVINPPEPVDINGKTFYMYGPGGGGITYPDQYFYNLNGKLLIFRFIDLNIEDKTPTVRTKELAREILSSFIVERAN